MIHLLATRYNKHIACLLGYVFLLGIMLPVYGRSVRVSKLSRPLPSDNYELPRSYAEKAGFKTRVPASTTPRKINIAPVNVTSPVVKQNIQVDGIDIDGPSQPEMSSFKPAGTNDMVNLFSGDFSYNIPLLDVGGYPVNIFYDGGISMEQEASWVGLGWNINPGNVNRNMRGVPDDFDGTEQLTQKQNMKKNITWGVSLGADFELVGSKQWNQFVTGSVGASIGVSVNNKLGPSIELGLKGTTSFSVSGKGISEKGPVGVSAGIGLNLSSRNGLTVSPNISLSAQAYTKASKLSAGIGLSTSYNSRSGIHALQMSGQMSMSYSMVEGRDDEKEVRGTATGRGGSMGASIIGSTISFTKPSYVPAMRTVITNSSGAGRFQLGAGMFGIYPSLEIEGYGQVSKIDVADQTMKKPMVGYMYAEKARTNRDAIMDFTRFNDQEVTPSTTIISVPQYSYDVFSVQGEGTGGTIRAYRNDNGYVRDNYTVSKDKSWSAGVDIGIPGHVGANFNTIKTPSSIGEWNNGNKLRTTTGFYGPFENKENVYHRNPGENSVLHPNQYDSIGGVNLVRFKLGGTTSMPTIEPWLQRFNNAGVMIDEKEIQHSIGTPEREKRTQVTTFLTAKEAKDIGLDKKIKNYDPITLLQAGNKLKYDSIARDFDFRKPNHISQITVTEADGRRYVYGLPVYNTKQKDFTFTVADTCTICDVVPFTTNEASLSSTHVESGIGGKDGYVQITETPAYAHSFLLSGLLSPDYVDVNGDGITEDDLGGAVKFNYSRIGVHAWRTPHSGTLQANSNPGNFSDTKDDKGIMSYGERESWHLHSIESKTMIAVFVLEDRDDGNGLYTPDGEFGPVNTSDNSMKRLKEIKLYNKADLKANGATVAKPVKTVHFGYINSLCPGTPDNNSGGKLTLERIWFTYNGQARNNKNQYVFSYTKGAAPVTGENPNYEFNASDRWGNYKPKADNPDALLNRDYPYALQDKTKADQYANAWNLKKILLPSGGQIEVEYESDDYAFVQNKRAAVMQSIIGFNNGPTNPTNNLYQVNGSSITENNYMFVKVPEQCTSKPEVYQKYLEGITQLAIRMTVNMPKGREPMTAYAMIEDYDVYNGAGFPAIWIRMRMVNGVSPLSQSSVEFIRQQLPGQAFPGYDVSDDSGIETVLNMISGLLDGIKSAFSNIPQYLRQQGLAQTVNLNRTFVRLNDPDGFKYGGGQRVKRVSLKDNWNRMTSPAQYMSIYGQEYNYTTTEVFNGVTRTISSGVASYEPSIGGEENPFQTIVQLTNEVPLGPASYGAIEMPVLDAFFPAPSVGYSKVTVTSIGKKQNPDTVNQKTRSAVGRQVSEFYTAKDFPVVYSHTPLDPATDKQAHVNPTLSFLYKWAFDSRAISQGFLVATNDMHGKMKSQSSYAENDPNTRINYTENFYRNTGVNGLNDKFDFAYNNQGGVVAEGNMGIDIELMTDTREFMMKSNSFEIQGQVDWMLPFPFPLWLPFVWPVVSESENVYRAVTTTKVINYHSVLDSVIVIDKGSQVSTKNLIYDAETGQVVVNRTNNEFDKPIYSINYPAYWAYSGMGLAYKNINAVYTGVTFVDGRITTPTIPSSAFESGDELYIMSGGSSAVCDPLMASPTGNILLWAYNTHKNTGCLTDPTPDFIFMDAAGKPYNRAGVTFRIVRSGKRNMLSAPLTSFVMMEHPVDNVTHKLTINTAGKVINSSAVEYWEKWQTDDDAFKKRTLIFNPTTCLFEEGDDCAGYLEKKINPYVKGLLGTFRGYRNMVFYGERQQTDPTQATNLPLDGFLANFTPYWNFNGSSNLVPDINNTKWVWNTRSTRFNNKGMEEETLDALGTYTSAQYGYAKTLPVAIANNSRYGNMFAENFEDYDYNDLLNNSGYNGCSSRYVDFSGLEYGSIVDANSLGFNAHTGKKVLRVDNGATVVKSIPVGFPGDGFTLATTPTTSAALYQTGADGSCYVPPQYQFYPPNSCSSSIGNMGMSHYFNLNSNPADFDYAATFDYIQYTQVPVCANYIFNMHIFLRVAGDFLGGGGTYTITIMNTDGYVFATKQLYCDAPWGGGGSGNDYTADDQLVAYLPPGIYKIVTNFTGSFPFQNVVQYYQSSVTGEVQYSTNLASTSYRSLNPNSGCNFTKAIPADQSMINPGFSLQPYSPTGNHKLVFSAWVREAATNVANYTNNEVQIDGGYGPIILKPTGPVIEGWQRYEGYFTPSGGAMELRFVNQNANGPLYFDDIRIHPFNSNLKSYVYDPVSLRLMAELDANNYASYYEYDEEGTLVRTKAETREGVKTITESRSAKQKNIAGF